MGLYRQDLEIQPIDIVLLRHEYLERAVEKRYNLTYEQAHNYAIKHFDYPRALLGRTKNASILSFLSSALIYQGVMILNLHL